jgi:XTP/dITP diphosphohydrolase
MPASVTIIAVPASAAPGSLTWPAWRALRTSLVFVPEASPWRQVLLEAGVPVEVVPDHDPRRAVDVLFEAVARTSALVWFDDGSAQAREVGEALEVRCGDDATAPVRIMGAQTTPGASVAELVAVMDRLRSPGGCPWDAAQTHESLLKHLLEEAYEVVDAVRAGDAEHLREELGDLLLQIVFHARIAQESAHGSFTIDDVATGITDKLVRRHPHVFGDEQVDDAAAVEARWEAAKRIEKGRGSVLDGVAWAQPALLLAQTLLRKAGPLGADAAEAVSGDPALQPLARELWDVVGRASTAGVDAEEALRAAAARFDAEVRGREPVGGT